jgi:hypothetical protein
MLKKLSSVVLTSLSPQRTQNVRLGVSLVAASLDELFEHPLGH